MNGKVEQVGAVKQDKRGNKYFTIKIDNTWYSCPGDESMMRSLENRAVGFSVTRPQQGNFNAWIKIEATGPAPDQPATAASTGDSNRVTWESYETMARLAHGLASSLEPDETGGTDPDGHLLPVTVDRSTARAAIVNTVMIAFSNGKIAQLEPDDVSPF